MKRYQHYWYPERGQYYPSRIAVLDIDISENCLPPDDVGGSGRGAQWCLTSVALLRGEPTGQRRLAGEGAASIGRALSSLTRSRETTWLIVPNACDVMGRLGFWDQLEDGQMQLCGKDFQQDRGAGGTGEDRADGVCIILDPPTIISCRPAGNAGKLLILDTRNFGWELLPEEMHHERRVEGYIAGVYALLRALQANSGASLRCTAASQAMSCLRSDWPVDSLHCHCHPAALSLERRALFGGRCEVFRYGEIPAPIYHLDVRNMYAAIYRTLPLPVSLRRYHDGSAGRGIPEQLLQGNCIASVALRGQSDDYPHAIREGVSYSGVDINTVLSGEELVRAYHRGDIDRVYEWAEYTCRPVLSGFADRWLGALAIARETGNQLEQQWIKRMLVACAGKFAETGKRWVGVPSVTERGPYSQWYGAGPDGKTALYRNVAWWTQRREEHGESYHSIPAISAFIAASGREQLRDIILSAGRQHTWYVDTDSIFTDETGYLSLVSAGLVRDGEVGFLRTIGVYDRLYVHDIRHYECGGTIRCAGVPKGEIKAGETREEYWKRVQSE